MEYILSFIVVLGVIILVHELGHFLAARAVGIRVDRFSIGFGPKLVGFRRGDTEYRIAAFPLGGYVKMAGMIDESMENPDDFDPSDQRLFLNKNFLQKTLVITAGVIMNMILAVVVLWGVYATRGVPSLTEDQGTVIDTPIQGFPAEKAGFQRGDQIVTVDGVAVERWTDLVEQISSRPEREIPIEFVRNGEHKTVMLTTRGESAPEGEGKVGKIGIGPLPTYEKVPFGQAFIYSAVGTWSLIEQTGAAFGRLFTGRMSVKELSGPLGIAKVSGDRAREGLSNLSELLAIISVNVGFLNILPIPALDGGHLLLILIEGVRRRPLSTKVKLWIQQVGMVLLIALMVVVVFNDIVKLR